MARYTGPVCKLCRREGEKLFLKGERCLSPKCPFERERGYPPGEHGRLARFRRRRRAQARQLVQHGHFVVNGRRTNIPSYIVRPQDTITVREGSRKRKYFKERAERLDEGAVPDWLSLDAEAMTARVLRVPAREDIDTRLNEQLIVEYYSR